MIPKKADNKTRNVVRKWCNSSASYPEKAQPNILIMIKDIINGNWKMIMIEANITSELQKNKAQETGENIVQSQIKSADDQSDQKPVEISSQNKSENLIYMYEGHSDSNQQIPSAFTFDAAALKMANTVFDNMKQDDDFSNFVAFALGLEVRDLSDFINVIDKRQSFALEEKQQNILKEDVLALR